MAARQVHMADRLVAERAPVTGRIFRVRHGRAGVRLPGQAEAEKGHPHEPRGRREIAPEPPASNRQKKLVIQYSILYYLSMKKTPSKYTDTTVKFEAPVVREVAGVLEENQTLTAFVREAVLRDVRRRKMNRAARQYRDLLSRDAAEAGAMEAWETAPLALEPARRTS